MATDDYVDLSKLDIPTPPGWSNNRDDLNISVYFASGRVIPRELTALGYNTVLPVITDNHDTYFVQAQKGSVKELFVWNAISGRLMAVQTSLALKEVMNMAGISVLNIQTSLLTIT